MLRRIQFAGCVGIAIEVSMLCLGTNSVNKSFNFTNKRATRNDNHFNWNQCSLLTRLDISSGRIWVGEILAYCSHEINQISEAPIPKIWLQNLRFIFATIVSYTHITQQSMRYYYSISGSTNNNQFSGHYAESHDSLINFCGFYQLRWYGPGSDKYYVYFALRLSGPWSLSRTQKSDGWTWGTTMAKKYENSEINSCEIRYRSWTAHFAQSKPTPSANTHTPFLHSCNHFSVLAWCRSAKCSLFFMPLTYVNQNEISRNNIR